MTGPEKLLKPEQCALLLVDFQAGLAFGVESLARQTLLNNAVALARTEVVKKMWQYIKKHKLQDPKNMRNIIADEILKPIFGGKAVVNMFEMTKHISNHLK